MTHRLTRLGLAALVAFSAAACSDVAPSQVETTVAEGRFDNRGKGPATASEPTIVDVALAATADPDLPSFALLYEAVTQFDDLPEILTSRGQYTVFAPTDGAFVALLRELGVTKDELFANEALLRDVLLYHITTGRRDAEDVTSSDRIRTLNRAFFSVDGAVITDANGRTSNIVATDFEASNGIVHVIDTVILP